MTNSNSSSSVPFCSCALFSPYLSGGAAFDASSTELLVGTVEGAEDGDEGAGVMVVGAGGCNCSMMVVIATIAQGKMIIIR